jgi:Bax protein
MHDNKHKDKPKIKVEHRYKVVQPTKYNHKRQLKFNIVILLGFIAVFVILVINFDNTTIDEEESADDIISLEHLEIPPLEIVYKIVPNFNAIEDVTEKKKKFFAYLLPEIRRQNSIVLREREVVMALSNQYSQKPVLSQQHRVVLDKLARKYQLVDEESTRALLRELVRRVDIIPPALILVQAANESAWGTSRFAQDGYNFFGLWCFRKGCGFVPSERNDDEVHEVAKFRNLSHAVTTYIRNLNRHYAYADLREIRAHLRAKNRPITAESLAQGLQNYSIRGQEYIDEILSMIRVNRKHMNLNT